MSDTTCTLHGIRNCTICITTRVWVEDLFGSLQVVVDYGYGPQLSLSVPSGRLAGYQEARDRGEAEAQAKIAEWVAGYVARGAVETGRRYFGKAIALAASRKVGV